MTPLDSLHDAIRELRAEFDTRRRTAKQRLDHDTMPPQGVKYFEGLCSAYFVAVFSLDTLMQQHGIPKAKDGE